jgi:cyclophilin family peptidyl-prolyl cis-trans isomerase
MNDILKKIDVTVVIIGIAILALCYFLYQKFGKNGTGNKSRGKINGSSRSVSKHSRRHGRSRDKSRRKNKREKETRRHKKKEHLAYLDIAINDEDVGRIVIKLFTDVVPNTCKNFMTICDGFVDDNGNDVSYNGCIFHRVIKDFMVQTGDIDERGGYSIYGNRFRDENFDIPHDRPYLVSMANRGKNTNGSQFFITTNECPDLDGKHVVFGIVIDGMDIVDEIEDSRTDNEDKPYDKIEIVGCGMIQ